MKKKPKFQRHPKLKRLKNVWRRPRGIHNKMKRRKKGKGALPTPGYGSPRKEKWKHPSGLYEILVHNVKDLKKVNPKKEVARIASSVGIKKRLEILKEAKKEKIKILNPGIKTLKKSEKEAKKKEEKPVKKKAEKKKTKALKRAKEKPKKKKSKVVKKGD
jgi:large subunit ribosomal protein L32e